MTYTHAPEFSQPRIVISNSRKELLASALNNSLTATMTRPEQDIWEPYTETPAERRANARAQRIAWLVDSM